MSFQLRSRSVTLSSVPEVNVEELGADITGGLFVGRDIAVEVALATLDDHLYGIAEALYQINWSPISLVAGYTRTPRGSTQPEAGVVPTGRGWTGHHPPGTRR